MTEPKKQLDMDGYRPSRAEAAHLAQFDVTETTEGEIEITANSPAPWQPSARQLAFLRNLFDHSEYLLSITKAIRALPSGKISEVKRWCRLEPGFLAMLNERVKEQLALSAVTADLTVAGTADGDIKPTADQKWAVGALLKIREFVHKKEIRFLQINQQFNFIGGDASDEDLRRVIDAGSNTAQKAIEAG